MSLSSVAIKRPVFTVMSTVALLVLGFLGFSRLGTDLFPDVSFPVVVVNVPYPGASPAEVETLVTKPMEDAVTTLNGIDRVRSFSREGLSTTMVIFKLGVDISEGATLVRERVAQARFKLPNDIKEPAVNRFDVSASPVAIYTLGSSKKSIAELRKLADDVIKPAVEQVAGVASCDIKGGLVREVHVDLDRARADALGLDPSRVVAELRAANLTVPAGHYDEGAREVAVRAVGEFEDVAAIRDLVVATAPDGSAVRLRDVAKVSDAFEEQRTRIRSNAQDAVSFQILKQSGQNTVAVADAAEARLRVLQKQLGDDVKFDKVFDQARFIRNNVADVEHSIVFGGLMAILVILVFMLDLRSTLISSVALPTSVIGTFFAMYLLGYSLNMMTLLGLSLAIGLLIDDAVVVRENIFKHLERGKPPAQAALDGTQEISLSVLATTMTIVAVFLPVAFVGGMVGQFFRQFGITISAAVILSLVVAFTLDPMLSSRYSVRLDDPSRHRFDGIKRPFLWFFEHLDAGYRGLLGWCLRHKLVVAGGALGSLVLMGFVGGLMGSEFVNAEDRGQFAVSIELPAGASLDESDRRSLAAERALLRDPDVKVVYATIGDNGDPNMTAWRVVTTTKEERSEHARRTGEKLVTLDMLRDRARQAAREAAPPGSKIAVTDPPFVEGAQAESPIMIDVRGASYEDIVPLATQVSDILRGTPGVADVNVVYSPGRPELRVEVDPRAAADRGVPVATAAMALRAALEGDTSVKLRQGKDEIPIRVRLDAADRDTAAAIKNVTLATPRGPVPLVDVARFVRGEGPQVIEREDRSRQIQVHAAMHGRALGDALKDFQPKIGALKLPPGASIMYDGQIRMMSETNSNMGLALLLGVVFIYIVLASQFESFLHPLTIMLTLPLAFVGAILGLFLTNNTMAMGAMIGIILLMGLVTKNAILLVDRAIVRVREEGETPMQAILEAGPERLRPILMTSAAMILGMLPTAIGTGEGSEFRAPMAIAVIGGVISSTLLSLVVVPVFYLALENLKKKLGMKQQHAVHLEEKRAAE